MKPNRTRQLLCGALLLTASAIGQLGCQKPPEEPTTPGSPTTQNTQPQPAPGGGGGGVGITPSGAGMLAPELPPAWAKPGLKAANS